ncbi:hypothetical protein L2K70_01855 [Nocardioides KLBMP 9356]|uniref:Uncharacterized protein n=1 Tax=Nocardioides potassii TaxID=2911371 RepID=A0ABS9H8J9_9ACTN|nr:glycosyl hydrolase [Nocardioides potassii]MCF6376343.1 hypothetical protein [Nocardioides potassii]
MSILAITGGTTVALPATATPDGDPPSTAAFASLNPVTPLTTSSFADPADTEKPWVRWNFKPADAATTDASLIADLEDMAAHNIGGVEIGQGGVPTKAQLTLIYNKAEELGITVSLKVASALPGGAAFANTNDLARRTLNFSRFDPVAAGGSIDADLPGTATGTVVAVVAYRCNVAGCPNLNSGQSLQVSLVRDSAIDLTSTLTGTNTSGYNGGSTSGHLNWTAPASPAGASWLVTVYRAVPFGTTPETLSTQGTKLVTDAYDAYFAGGLGDLVKANGGDFFVDSHASDPWGAPEELWSTNMRTEFQTRAGYDIVPVLAALTDTTMQTNLTTTYTFSDGSSPRIRSDFNKIRSDLFTQNRIVPFQNWAHTYNMKLRLQQEDGPATSIGDELQTSAVLDRSEYESLTGSDQTDLYRPMASANHMTGNTWYSTECCAVLSQSWAETTEDMIVRMNHEFSAGVTRFVYHTRPSTATSTSSWPGPSFNGGDGKVSFSNAYNSQNPYYTDAAAVNDHFARTTTVLTQGTAKMDLAVYMRNYSSPAAFQTTDPSNKHWQDTSLQRAGWTWDYTDEALMDLPNATVTNGRLAANGPAYQAIIFDQFLLPTTNSARSTLSVKAAQKMLSYAQAGLPVIFVGNPTNTGSFPASTDADLTAVLTQLRANPNFYHVPSEAAVPGKLANLGLKPAAENTTPSSIMSVRRRDVSTGTNYYWLYNQGLDAYVGNNSVYGQNPSNLYEDPEVCHTTGSILNPCMATGRDVDTTVTLEGAGVPIKLDTWSGEITPIADYTRNGDRVAVPVELARDDTTVIALTTNPAHFGVSAPAAHVTSTNARGVTTAGGKVFIKAGADGTYTTAVDGGPNKLVTTEVTNVPAAINLTNSAWSLDVEDWQPQAAYGTTGPAGSETKKPVVSVTLDGLKPWGEVPAIADASGVGTYKTTVTLPANWNVATHGASLDLGQVTDSFRLAVNGTNVPANQVSGLFDISPYLHAGDNTLAVRVATTLNNRLYSLDGAVRNRGLLQENGLVGPVVVSPYRLVQVDLPPVVTNPPTGTPAPLVALTASKAPTLKGIAKVGRKLTVRNGTWAPSTPVRTYTYKWLRNGKVIRSAHGMRYKLRKVDAGKRIRAVVTASSPGYASGTARTASKKVRK